MIEPRSSFRPSIPLGELQAGAFGRWCRTQHESSLANYFHYCLTNLQHRDLVCEGMVLALMRHAQSSRPEFNEQVTWEVIEKMCQLIQQEVAS